MTKCGEREQDRERRDSESMGALWKRGRCHCTRIMVDWAHTVREALGEDGNGDKIHRRAGG